MKKLNITKERFEKSRYFKNKYGTLEYVSENGNLYKTNKGKVLTFKEAIMGGGGYEPSYDDDEEPLAEWKVGEIVDIDAWQVMWEYGDEEPLPEKRWKIVNVERDENYDDCDGYCYTIVNVSNPKLKVEVSASALVERKSVKKLGGKIKKSTKKFGRKFKESVDDDDYARFAMSDLTDSIEKYLKSNKDDLDLESVERVMDYNTSLLLTFNTGNKIKISFDDELD